MDATPILDRVFPLHSAASSSSLFGKDATPSSALRKLFERRGAKTKPQSAFGPFPVFRNGNNFDLSGVDHYNALQAQLQKRFSGGLSFLVAYTLSKTMSIRIVVSTFNGLPIDKFNKKQNWSIAGDDQTHILNVSGVYELPIGPVAFLEPWRPCGEEFAQWLAGQRRLAVRERYAIADTRHGSPLRTGNFANLVQGQASKSITTILQGLPVFNLAAFLRLETLHWVMRRAE